MRGPISGHLRQQLPRKLACREGRELECALRGRLLIPKHPAQTDLTALCLLSLLGIKISHTSRSLLKADLCACR